jgi:hypothetical protein
MLDMGMIPAILKDAKRGSFDVLKEFIDAVGRLDEDTQYKILTTA